MEPFYLPNDPTAHERENERWRKTARYDWAENLFFQLRDENWSDLIDAHARSWHVSAVWGFSCRGTDRGDGKYPWTSLETKLDNVVRSRFPPVRRVTLPGVLAAGLAACSFNCVGRLIRRYTPQNDDRGGLGIHGPKLGRRPRFATLALPIPAPAQDARQMMDRARDSVRNIFFSQLDAGPVTRQFRAEQLARAQTVVTEGTRLNNALGYRSGHWKLTPTEVGELLGNIDYFRRCWEDFHKAEKSTVPLPEVLMALVPGLTHCPLGYIDTVLDNALAERKAASDNAADWFKFIALVSHNAEKLPLDLERRTVVMDWAKLAKSNPNELLSRPQVPTAEQTDSAALKVRLQHLTGITRRVLARADTRLSGLDPGNVARNENEISCIEQRLKELECLLPLVPAVQPLDTPATSAITEPPQPVEQHNDLPLAVRKRLDYFPQLLARLVELNTARSLTTPPVPDTDADKMLGILKLDYEETALDSLLRSLNLIEDAPSLDTKMDTKPAQWVAVIKALDKRLSKNKRAVFVAFSQRYGKGIGSLRAFQYPYNGNNDDANWCYTRALALLGKA